MICENSRIFFLCSYVFFSLCSVKYLLINTNYSVNKPLNNFSLITLIGSIRRFNLITRVLPTCLEYLSVEGSSLSFARPSLMMFWRSAGSDSVFMPAKNRSDSGFNLKKIIYLTKILDLSEERKSQESDSSQVSTKDLIYQNKWILIYNIIKA